MTVPLKPEHADRDYPISGVDSRITVRRHLDGYAYALNGNAHNPSPRYRWYLLLNGRIVDSGSTKRELVAAARDNGRAYISEGI